MQTKFWSDWQWQVVCLNLISIMNKQTTSRFTLLMPKMTNKQINRPYFTLLTGINDPLDLQTVVKRIKHFFYRSLLSTQPTFELCTILVSMALINLSNSDLCRFILIIRCDYSSNDDLTVEGGHPLVLIKAHFMSLRLKYAHVAKMNVICW